MHPQYQEFAHLCLIKEQPPTTAAPTLRGAGRPMARLLPWRRSLRAPVAPVAPTAPVHRRKVAPTANVAPVAPLHRLRQLLMHCGSVATTAPWHRLHVAPTLPVHWRRSRQLHQWKRLRGPPTLPWHLWLVAPTTRGTVEPVAQLLPWHRCAGSPTAPSPVAPWTFCSCRAGSPVAPTAPVGTGRAVAPTAPVAPVAPWAGCSRGAVLRGTVHRSHQPHPCSFAPVAQPLPWHLWSVAPVAPTAPVALLRRSRQLLRGTGCTGRTAAPERRSLRSRQPLPWHLWLRSRQPLPWHRLHRSRQLLPWHRLRRSRLPLPWHLLHPWHRLRLLLPWHRLHRSRLLLPWHRLHRSHLPPLPCASGCYRLRLLLPVAPVWPTVAPYRSVDPVCQPVAPQLLPWPPVGYRCALPLPVATVAHGCAKCIPEAPDGLQVAITSHTWLPVASLLLPWQRLHRFPRLLLTVGHQVAPGSRLPLSGGTYCTRGTGCAYCTRGTGCTGRAYCSRGTGSPVAPTAQPVAPVVAHGRALRGTGPLRFAPVAQTAPVEPSLHRWPRSDLRHQ
jgi:hypothetical protein